MKKHLIGEWDEFGELVHDAPPAEGWSAVTIVGGERDG